MEWVEREDKYVVDASGVLPLVRFNHTVIDTHSLCPQNKNSSFTEFFVGKDRACFVRYYSAYFFRQAGYLNLFAIRPCQPPHLSCVSTAFTQFTTSSFSSL